VADALQTLLGMAKDRPDPKIVTQWLTAYLGKRPVEIKQSILATLAQDLARSGADARVTGLVSRVIQKLQNDLA
jgi:hypothetical protein